MLQPSITVEGLSKRYRLGGGNVRYRTIRDLLSGASKDKTHEVQDIWALRGVDLSIGEGEAVGLIGHNGAGKSTLLKILSRITEPSEGTATLYGRVASLLEVGTGFHPELTGRENIFLNGAILGMTRAEIRRDFDAIVAFAEIEQFLDTPVKRYSSGMYVRLAFAVAAHLTPEILLVDEVLAVGDMDFQRRCLGRMGEVARSGRTVIFVSHNLASIESLCPRSILLRGGQVVKDGPTRDVLLEYVSRRGGEALWDLRGFADREGNGKALLTGIEVRTADGSQTVDAIEFRAPFRVRMHYDVLERLPGSSFGFAVLTEKNERVFLSDTWDSSQTFQIPPGSGSIDCTIRAPNLLPGMYRLEVWITWTPGHEMADHVRMVGALEITANDVADLNVTALTAGPARGHVYLDTKWERL